MLSPTAVIESSQGRQPQILGLHNNSQQPRFSLIAPRGARHLNDLPSSPTALTQAPPKAPLCCTKMLQRSGSPRTAPRLCSEKETWGFDVCQPSHPFQCCTQPHSCSAAPRPRWDWANISGKKNLLLHPLRPVEFLQLEKGNPRELPVPSFCCSPWGLILAACTPISYLNPECVLRCPSDHRGPEAVQAGEIPAEKGFANNASSANTTWLSSAALTESGTQILLTD